MRVDFGVQRRWRSLTRPLDDSIGPCPRVGRATQLALTLAVNRASGPAYREPTFASVTSTETGCSWPHAPAVPPIGYYHHVREVAPACTLPLLQVIIISLIT